MPTKTSFYAPVLSTLLAASLATVSPGAVAAVISQSDTYSTSLFLGGDMTSMDEQYETAFGFSAFDSSLGVLSQVIIDISSSQSLNVTLFNENTTGGDYSFNSNYGNVAGNFSNGSAVETTTSFTDSANGYLEAGESIDVAFGPQSSSSNVVLSGADLLPFIDSGLFTLTVGIFQNTSFYVNAPSAEFAGFQGNTDLETTVSIQYVYEPSSVTVPEPGPLMLLGMGLFAFRMFRRS